MSSFKESLEREKLNLQIERDASSARDLAIKTNVSARKEPILQKRNEQLPEFIARQLEYLRTLYDLGLIDIINEATEGRFKPKLTESHEFVGIESPVYANNAWKSRISPPQFDEETEMWDETVLIHSVKKGPTFRPNMGGSPRTYLSVVGFAFEPGSRLLQIRGEDLALHAFMPQKTSKGLKDLLQSATARAFVRPHSGYFQTEYSQYQDMNLFAKTTPKA